jgi:aminoglycoside 3-N-acetyltransferase
MAVTESAIATALRALGLGPSSVAIVHTSLRSFGCVEGGAETVCRALVASCGTVLLPAAIWDRTGLVAPPGLMRPHNAYRMDVVDDPCCSSAVRELLLLDRNFERR